MNEPVSKKPRRANIAMTIAGIIAAIFGVAVVHLLVPTFHEVFVSFGAELPFLTRVFTEHRLVLWLLPLAVPAIATCVRVRESGDTKPGVVALLIGLAIAIGLPLICALAMYLPIFKLAAVVG